MAVDAEGGVMRTKSELRRIVHGKKSVTRGPLPGLTDDMPARGAPKGVVGAKVGDEPDKLQRWKLEKKAREEQKEGEDREAAMLN